ncbi:unnamed protein product, partial [Durusdinium trenchii]
ATVASSRPMSLRNTSTSRRCSATAERQWTPPGAPTRHTSVAQRALVGRHHSRQWVHQRAVR